MKKIKDIFSILFYPLLFLSSSYIILIIFVLFFNLFTSYNLGTEQYQNALNIFVDNSKVWISIISLLLLGPLFWKKTNKQFNKIKITRIIILIVIGVAVSLSYNLLLCGLNKISYFTNIYDAVPKNLLVPIICSGIIGPILEELVFRGIVYERLLNKYSRMKATILTGLLFAVMHGNIIQFIYTFFFNFILVKVYDQDKNILSPIIVHISANTILNLVFSLMLKLNIVMTLSFSFVFSVILIFILKKLYKGRDIG